MTELSIDDSFSQRAEELRAERGDNVAITEVAEVVKSLLQTMDGDLSSLDIKLYREINQLASYVQNAKREIAEIQPDNLRNEQIPKATYELDAIVKSTEDATGNILDCAEELETISGDLEGETSQRVLGVVTKIYEACNFQDLTGQRITKVVSTLKHIEQELEKLTKVFGDEIKNSAQKAANRPKDGRNDAHLLNGPQQAEQAATQEEIDALLASFD
jgi:chemotaxis protein CheZ